MSSKAPNNRPAKYKLAPPRRSAALIRGVNKLKTYKTQKSTTSKKSQDLLDNTKAETYLTFKQPVRWHSH